MAEPGEGCYVYCVAPAGEHPSFDDVPGIASGSPIDLVADECLSAVVSRVSLGEFGEEALRRNFEDMDWLERTARAHQAVLGRVLEQTSAMVPMRLCTIFDDDEHVRKMLERERDVLVDALERVRDRSEWSVKVLADSQAIDAAARASGGHDQPPPDARGAGHAYVARKQEERSLRDRGQALLAAATEDIHTRLSQDAEAVNLLPPQRSELSGRSGTMVLNGAYLVHRSRVEAFAAAVDQLRERHRDLRLDVELGGPWAPYNFVSLEQPV
jgi:Gas vesicle synthesis protein GvpL/GvpF